eukprot:COSAG02_NODE_42323_length_385_cov_1.248252_1_plen_96_part_10
MGSDPLRVDCNDYMHWLPNIGQAMCLPARAPRGHLAPPLHSASTSSRVQPFKTRGFVCCSAHAMHALWVLGLPHSRVSSLSHCRDGGLGGAGRTPA